MANDNAFKVILDTLPPKPCRSRLEPFAELIRELRRRGRTYREIARILSERCDIHAPRSTVNDFIRARSQRTRNSQKCGSHKKNARSQNSVLLPKSKIATETGLAMDEIQKRIADLRRRSVPTKAESQPFNYDPGKPLYIPPKPKKS